MIQSMTGYGSAQSAVDGVNYAIEVRSVNHRYLKLSVRVPEAWQFAEPSIEKLMRAVLSRGSVSLALRIREERADLAAPVNVDILQAYANRLTQVKVPTGVQATIDLGALAQLPGVIEPPPIDEEARKRQLTVIENLARKALDVLLAMRRDEGVTLRGVLLESCQSIRGCLNSVAERAPHVIDEYHERLRTRVGRLVAEGGYELDQQSLAREVALYAERCDVTEEMVRLASHLEQFADWCDRKEPSGRTLDFIAQELLREANTIASKSNDAGIARAIVEVKGHIDRLKEQVQNVE